LVWDTASQSIKRQDMLEILGVMAPLSPLTTPMGIGLKEYFLQVSNYCPRSLQIINDI